MMVFVMVVCGYWVLLSEFAIIGFPEEPKQEQGGGDGC